VTDQGVDTGDLNQHVKFDNYTYIQLLSETASFDKTINRKLQQQASSFRSKKHPNSPMSLARSKSQLTHKTTVDVSTLTENRYRRDEPTPDDDITDILRRYNINGYSENIPTDTANTSLTETVSFFNNQLERAPKSTPTTSDVYKHIENNNITSPNSNSSTSTRFDLNDLFLDLELCVSTPRQEQQLTRDR